MILFKEKSIDEGELYLKASDAFYKAASNLHSDDIQQYQALFGGYSVSDLKTALARISYSKNFEIDDLFYFDQGTSFHLYVLLYIYAYDEDLDKVSVCAYTLMLDEKLEVLDDFMG